MKRRYGVIIIVVILVFMIVSFVGYELMEKNNERILNLAMFEDAQEYLLQDSWFQTTYGTIVSVQQYQNNAVEIVGEHESDIPCIVTVESQQVYLVWIHFDWQQNTFSYKAIDTYNITAT